ncbi:MAG: transporter substrate-binding domain-containing protein [Alphaproteobacteria bacterium]|jgi:polar amino acid transport system substrate-binding protein|nr:transporter substrate-binding domain-containing protein [Alphaproteobacteria bacterium]MBT4085827.1 transporter substrate-binding domain-containing protein [Alphaproteobacteria bacterium]MBT4542700.1 transporter substrate-binding domain-containing protein [Alphaproteobacteria bacterium]MBT7748180.1 transporter substrate-binding domain-containing protein [Alphaproteobacteria bacterium]
MSVNSTIIRIVALSGILLSSTLAAAEPLKMAYNSDWPPFSSGAGDAVGGILPGLLDHLVTKRLGLATVHSGYPWKRVQQNVKTGRQDALITVPTESRLKWSQSSKSVVYEVEMRAVVKRGSKADKILMTNPEAARLGDFRVCDILGNGWGSRFMKTNNISYETASNVSRCLEMISKGRMDVTIQSVAVAGQKIRESSLGDDLRVLPNTYGSMAFTLLVSKKMPGADDFLKKFDDLVVEMKDDGSLAILIEKLRSN